MIGLAGGSCSGKTALAKRLVERLHAGEAAILGLDSYYRDQPAAGWGDLNFDVPDAIEKSLLVEQMQSLAKGNEIDKPVYDYVSHSRLARTERILPHSYIIIEGLFVLYWEDVRTLLRTKVFIDVDHTTCLERRLERDTKERGRTVDSVLKQYRKTVRPMYEKYVRDTREFSDLVLDGLKPLDDLVSAVETYIKKPGGR